MKGISSFCVALCAFAVNTAHAQQVETESTAAASSAGSRSAEGKSEVRSEKGAGDASAYGLPVDGAEQGTIEAHFPGVFKKIGGEYWSRSDLGKDSLHNSDPAAQTLNRFSLLYKPDDRRIYQIMQEVDVIYGHIGNDMIAATNDPYLGYVDTKLAHFADWNLKGSLRLYVPTGVIPHFTTKRLGALAGFLLAEKSSGRFDFSNFFFAIQHNQTQNSYPTPVNGVMVDTANDNAEIDNYFEVDYNFNDKLAAYQMVGLENVWERPMPLIGVQQHRLFFNETGCRYKVSRTMSVAVSYANDASMLNPSSHSGLQVYRDDESWYRLYIDASI